MKTYYLTSEPLGDLTLVRVTDNPTDKTILLEIPAASFTEASQSVCFELTYRGRTGMLQIANGKINAEVLE